MSPGMLLRLLQSSPARIINKRNEIPSRLPDAATAPGAGGALLRSLHLSGAELGSRARSLPESSGIRAEPYPARRLHRDQPRAPGGARRRLLQPARYGGTMHQGREGSDQMDAAVMPFLRRQRRPPPASRARL